MKEKEQSDDSKTEQKLFSRSEATTNKFEKKTAKVFHPLKFKCYFWTLTR